MISIIAAVSSNGVIGTGSEIPWIGKYPEDLKFFKRLTTGGIVIMGRKTFESIGRPLPNRTNIVITSKPIESNVIKAPSLEEALISAKQLSKPIWIIGGGQVYFDSLPYADEIHLTLIPEEVVGKDLIKFPWINPLEFNIYHLGHLDNSNLRYVSYQRVR